MGKTLVIKGADFADSALNNPPKFLSAYGFATMGGAWDIRYNPGYYGPSGEYACKIVVVDVSNNIGDTIELYYNDESISDLDGKHRSWAYFASSLGELTENDLKFPRESGYPDTKVPIVGLVKPSPYNIDGYAPAKLTSVVPEGAKYLIFPLWLVSSAPVRESDMYVHTL